MKLYHATTRKKAKQILSDKMIKCEYGFGFVYLTPDLEMAKRFGEEVFAIDSAKLESKKLGVFREPLCDVYQTASFHHYADDIPVSRENLLNITP